jgi:hypothetical protein
MKLKNSKHLLILTAINNLLESGRSASVVVENQETKKPEKIEIHALVKIPTKLSYYLLKNINKLKSIEKLREETLEKIREEFKTKESFDEQKYQSDEKYQKELDASLVKFVEESELYREFLDDETEVDYHLIRLSDDSSEDKTIISLKDIDPESKFDLVYIPSLLLDTIIELV